ncbi:MAG: FAD-binding oxidoreductase [Candidatus Hodarchaeota archaeon]
MSGDIVLDKLVDIVGNAYVKKDSEAYIVSPGNTEDIQNIIQAANQQKFNIHIKTCDDNYHGIDDLITNDVILDFYRMNKIQDLDKISRAITIQPGVSFLQLQTELNKYEFRAMNPLGLPASISVLNCYIERVPLFSAPKPLLANGWQCILTMDVVLPTGEILKTGASSMKSMKKPFYWPFGGGPDMSRVFTAAHGNLGIVAKATIKIKAMPQSRKLLFLAFSKIEDAVDVLYKIQRIELGEECLLSKNFNLAAMLSKNSADFKSLVNELPQWTLLLCLAGPEEKIKYQEEDFKDLGLTPIDSLENFADDLLNEFLCPQRISRILEYKTICRKISFYTTLDRLSEFNSNILSYLGENNYSSEELGTFITPVELGRACFVEYYIYADPTKPNEKEMVEKLYIDLYQLISNLGGNVDRPNKRIDSIVYSKNPMFKSFLKSIKNQLDPNNIINPKKLSI